MNIPRPLRAHQRVQVRGTTATRKGSETRADEPPPDHSRLPVTFLIFTFMWAAVGPEWATAGDRTRMPLRDAPHRPLRLATAGVFFRGIDTRKQATRRGGGSPRCSPSTRIRAVLPDLEARRARVQDPLRPRHAPAHLGSGSLEREMIEPQLPKNISYSSTGMSI